ncbi:MAG: SOS response-associated peptidase, partial [Pseudomonadota bacterium]
RYNIAPTQPVHVVFNSEKGRALTLMRWQFLPGWVKDPKKFPFIINARCESVAEKPAFRNAVRRRRAVLPAPAFYEWETTADGKRPMMFTPDGEDVVGLAAIWETWFGPDGEEMDGVAILTSEAEGVPARYHDRMPLTVPLDHLDPWLDPLIDTADEALALTEKHAYSVQPVSKRLSNARNEGVGLLSPDEERPAPEAEATEPSQGSLF